MSAFRESVGGAPRPLLACSRHRLKQLHRLHFKAHGLAALPSWRGGAWLSGAVDGELRLGAVSAEKAQRRHARAGVAMAPRARTIGLRVVLLAWRRGVTEACWRRCCEARAREIERGGTVRRVALGLGLHRRTGSIDASALLSWRASSRGAAACGKGGMGAATEHHSQAA